MEHSSSSAASTLRPPFPLFRRIPVIHTPTLLIWGNRDPYLQPQLTRALDQWVPNLRTIHFPSASHWVHHDEPDRVNSLLLEFLNS